MVKISTVASVLCALSIRMAFAQQAAPIATPEAPAPIDPPTTQQAAPPVQQQVPAATDVSTSGTTAVPPASITSITASSSGKDVKEFQGDDAAQVLRLLARQAKINIVVSDKVDAAQMKVTMRLEDKTPIEAINIIATAKGLIVDQIDGVYYVKTKEEKESEPTESANYTLSYAHASDVLPLLAGQLQSKAVPQFDQRTNTIFYRETKSNLKNIKLFLDTIDKPTTQVMIEARLVEVNANPKQSYGLNWAGVVGSSATPKKFSYGGDTSAQSGTGASTHTVTFSNGTPSLNDFTFGSAPGTAWNKLSPYAGQLAILSAPQMSVTLRLLNEDSDAQFLANPRVVTANNTSATIKITRNQPIPKLDFNSQTATTVFSGFEDKVYGNTLTVLPIINKDDFVTLNVKPEISNKVDDQHFLYQGTDVSSPIIDMRTLESNVLIKSGDTLAVGGLLQDESTKGSTKVPALGDIPVLGYLFQEKLNTRTKRNLLIFVTPTIIKQGYGTGLENQVTGLHNSNGEEFANPNGWRNNAKGAIRLVPTSHEQNVSSYPKPGEPMKQVSYKGDAASRE